MRLFRYLVICLLLMSITACGGGGGGGTSSPVSSQGTQSSSASSTNSGGSTAPIATTGTIQVESVLARSVPSNVDQLRFTGRTASATVVYGPDTRAKSADITLDNVPTSVVTLQIEYLAQGQLIGSFTGPVNVPAGGVATVNDPAWQDVAASLVSIQISPPGGTVAAGLSLNLQAIGVFSDSSTQNLSTSVTWATSNSTIATVTAGLVNALEAGVVNVTATLNSVQGQASLTVTNAQLQTLQISGTPSVASGISTQLQVQGNFSDGSHQDLTSQAVWSFLPAGVAQISQPGQVLGIEPGQGNVTATVGAVSTSNAFTVTAAVPTSLEISPSSPTLADGLTQQFQATLLLSDSTKQDITTSATWSSLDPTVATISGGGLAQTVNPGSTSITASFGQLTASTNLTVSDASLVSLELTPSNATTAKGVAVNFSAYGVYTDGVTRSVTGSVLWTSSPSTVVSIDPVSGIASALATGTATVNATLDGISVSTPITVTPATLTSLTVLPLNPSLGPGGSVQLQAQGSYSDGTSLDVSSSVSWTSNNSTVATVSASGLAQALTLGSTTVGASLQGISNQVTLNVVPRAVTQITLSPPNGQVIAGQNLQLKALAIYNDNTTLDVTALAIWAGNGVSNADSYPGKLFTGPTQQGTIVVNATYGGVTGQTNVTVLGPTFDTLQIRGGRNLLNSLPASGLQFAFQASVYQNATPSQTTDVTQSATWSSQDPTVLQVSNAPGTQGLVTSIGAGTTFLQAQFQGHTATYQITVGNATLTSIAVTAPSTINVGETESALVNGTFSDGSKAFVNNFVPVLSSDPTILVNVGGGTVVGLKPGTVRLTATAGNGLTAYANVTVTAAPLTTLAFTPGAISILEGGSFQTTLIANYADGSQQNVTASATYSSNSSLVAVDNSSGQAGLLTAGSIQGTATITANYQGVTTQAVVTVLSTVVSIDVSPSPATVAVNGTQQLSVIANYQDGTSANVTPQICLVENGPDIAGVSSAGLINGKLQGQAVIRVGYFEQFANVTVNVQGPALQSITLSPGGDQTVAGGAFLFLRATGNYANGSSAVITQDLNLTSSNTQVATVQTGLTYVQAVNPGMSTITLTDPLSGVSTAFQLTVGPVVVRSLSINTDTSLSTPIGYKFKAQVLASFSNSTSMDVTSVSNLSSSNSQIATVASDGTVTVVGAGPFSLNANYQGLPASASLTAGSASVAGVIYAPGSTVTMAVDTRLSLSARLALSDGTSYLITNSSEAQGLQLSSSDSTKLIVLQSGSMPELAAVAAGDVMLTLTDPYLGLSTQVIVHITP